jgi:hypothetical protein
MLAVFRGVYLANPLVPLSECLTIRPKQQLAAATAFFATNSATTELLK